MKTVFIRTQDARIIAIPACSNDGDPHFTNIDSTSLKFNLTNPLKTTALAEARLLAKEAGTRLRNPDEVAIR